MGPMRTTICTLLFVFLGQSAFAAQPPPAKPADDKLPITGLAPAKVIPDLCLVKYRVSTASPECQALFDQGLGYLYSYVWMEAARSFGTVTLRDPDCAMAWWGLSLALQRWDKQGVNDALLKAHELRDRASHREQQLILARMQERGLVPGGGDAEAQRRAAIHTIDTMLSLYDDDEEAWFFRAQLACGRQLFGGTVASVPFYKALLRVNALHPGANHELVHFYEGSRRPALGWVYAENYIKSSPNIPHAFHMQAHLATRLGRWDKVSDRSSRAITLERAYHKHMHVKPSDDHQFGHHLEVLTISLIHDGRFREARAVKAEASAAGFKQWGPWFRLHLAEPDWDEALNVVEQMRRADKVTASYWAALVYLKKGDPVRALPEVAVLQHAIQERKGDPQLELHLWETQGLWMCQSGDADAGLKLLAKTVERSKSDYGQHSWGHGAYYMEAWGTAALQTGQMAVAEEAFLEALAHDPGSVRAALGLQVLCERQGRSAEAARYAELARYCWRRADAQCLDLELRSLRGEKITTQATSSDPHTTERAK
jgi:Tfp pilus assembly protein PilF